MSHSNYGRLFVLDSDASNNSITIVLSYLDINTENPLVFSSRARTRTQLNYSTTKREALAVVQINVVPPLFVGYPLFTSQTTQVYNGFSSKC